MLDEMRVFKERLHALSESAKNVTKAIEGVLDDDIRDAGTGAGLSDGFTQDAYSTQDNYKEAGGLFE